MIFFVSVSTSYSADTKFYHINTIHGISMREISSVCKDTSGFIWASSKTGILRLTEDGYRTYQLPYKTADITSLKLVYKHTRLVAYTNNGQIFLYNELYDRFDFLTDLRTLSKNRHIAISNIEIDNTGDFWIAASDGLYKYKKHQLLSVGDLRNETYYVRLLDNKQLFYANRIGIGILNTETSSYTFINTNRSDNIIQVSSLFNDKNNNILWIGTFSHGLYKYDLSTNTFTEFPIKELPKQPILALEGSSNNSLFMGVDGQGLWELSKDGSKVLNIYKEDMNNPSSLRGDGIYDIFCDENKRVWVATYTGGLSFFEQDVPLVNHITHRINNNNSLGNNEVHQILEDHKGNIWFATDNGITRWNPGSNQWDVFYQNNREQAKVFLALCEDNLGNIWGGTYSSGIYILDSNTGKKLRHYSGEIQKPDMPGKFIFDIFKDSEGDIWIGGISDVVCFLSKENRFRSYPVKRANSFTELSPDRILASYNHGIAVLNKESGNVETLLDECLPNDVIVIDNHLWVATSGNGLIKYNYIDKTQVQFSTHSGLVSNYVNSIIATNGYLWIGTENGLCQLNLANNSILTYPSIHSLSNLSFNINSCTRLRNGDLIWGTNNGAITYTPDKLFKNIHKGKIFFQDIIVSGRSIRENPNIIKHTPIDKQTGITLNHSQNNLSMELVPIGILSKGVKYSWKMEGLDSDWSQPSDFPVINYANLPSGNFRLMIKMLDNSLSHVIDERSLEIQILPPFWQTWWFRLLIIVIVIGIITYILRIYSNQLKQKHAKDKIRFFTNMAHDIRTSLTLISAPIEQLERITELSEKNRYYLDLATEQSQKLSSVVTQLLDFEKTDNDKEQLFVTNTDIVQLISNRCSAFSVVAEKENVNILFSSNLTSYTTGVDELKIEKIVDNLISNAIKYSNQGGKVEISLICKESVWSFEVKDHGLGISENAKSKLFKEFYRGDNKANSKIVGSGIGLLLVKNYVTLHGGKIEYESEENMGSTFRIEIPSKEVTENTIQTDSIIADAHVYSNREIDIPETSNNKLIRILFVEDNTDLQTFLHRALEDTYKVTTANDGIEAWGLIQKEIFDVVISDIMMPNMDGFELCKKIKSTFETSHIPVILLTSLSHKTKQLEGLGLGADDYITKPFDITLLLQRVKTIFKNREIIKDKTFKLLGQTSQEEEQVYSNELNDQFVKNALNVVTKNISNSYFGKDEFASEMNVSPSLLYQKLKALTGQSPLDFIRTIRFKHAMELLLLNKYSMLEISEMCGFSSASYFSTAFKKYFGRSPIEVNKP